ncbi:MAG: hypothetical protein ACI4JB_03010 [Porcipelethomonas sp.]
MLIIKDLEEFESENISPELKAFLTEKFSNIVKEYDLDGMSGMFSVILLSENESDYIADKLLEFWEELTYDNCKWIHTVWAASDGYSEDIYIPYTAENALVVERRCS